MDNDENKDETEDSHETETEMVNSEKKLSTGRRRRDTHFMEAMKSISQGFLDYRLL